MSTSASLVLYKKKTYNLQLSQGERKLKWTPVQSGGVEGSVSTDNLVALFASKPDSPKVALRITVTQPSTTTTEDHNFVFVNASSALSDREILKKELSVLLAANKARKAQGPEEVVNDGGRSAEEEIRVRRELFKKDPQLAALHKELVRESKVITEEEFWEGREALLETESLLLSQQSGRIAQMVQPKLKAADANKGSTSSLTVGSGGNDDLTITITAQMIHDIFEMFPIVGKIYAERVPKQLSQTSFWSRYFQSKLFHQLNRTYSTDVASASTNSIDNIKPDPIFDLYLGMEDDDIEPKNLQTDEVYRLLDLRATEEDHGETGNTNDFTMQAGRQKNTLPLIRRFNEHSERLLDEALGKEVKRRRVDPSDRAYFSEILLDDLEGQTEADRIAAQTASEATANGATAAQKEKAKEEDGKVEQDTIQSFRDAREMFRDRDPNLADFEVDDKAISLSMRHLSAILRGRHDRSSRALPTLPPSLFRSVVSCQATTNEFLRHFWTAVLSVPMDEAKAEKMMGYLGGTEERINGIIVEAQKQGEAERVAVAMRGVQDQVKKAREHWTEKRRKKP
ncbi:hypothetical protein BT69DRAFT_1281143 [Atractiella rhizophila]|nr:hypothetical protein BT69DRAFT_1281143 [Atractiella rhizophila]